MPKRDITIAMVGAGGDGIVTMGDVLSLAAARDGLNVLKTEAYGPQIRGGESSSVVRLSADPIYESGDGADVLVVFSWADFSRFKGECTPARNAVVLSDEADPIGRIPSDLGLSEDAIWIKLPFGKRAADSGAKGSKNLVGMGVLVALFDLPADTLRRAVVSRFGRKKAAVGEAALKAFEAGILLGQTLPPMPERRLAFTPGPAKLIMSGNEATAIGALHAGCRYFAGYPITPSTEILMFLDEWLPKMGGSLVQTEDELSAIGAVLGASFAGEKALTATSGPGLSLMTEMLGLASMAELPCVVVNVQRGGPSTGLPTKSEQSDLFQAVYGGHGDMPRVVLACSDVEDSFHATVDAFNIAEEYQIPVIVLSDQLVAGRRETFDPASLVHEVRERRLPSAEELTDYHRYRDTPDGVSPMARPGVEGGIYQTNGLEHDEEGSPGSGYALHEKMNAKRYRKLGPIVEAYAFHRRFGPEDADVGILCWGSSMGAVREAVARANARGERVAAFIPRMIHPFPKKECEAFLKRVGRILVVELSFAAQFHAHLRTFLDLPEDRTRVYKRSGGRNLTVAEIDAEIVALLASDRVPEAVSA